MTTVTSVRPRLLYLEDDPVIAEMTCEVLAEAYEVEHVADGTAGRRRALDGRFDVMLIDRRLPGVDGAEIIAAVRTARITTPILVLTALGAVADRVEGLDAGANDYLVKPFDFDELLARLRALVRGYRAQGRRREIGEWLFTPDVQALYSPTGARIALTATENAVLELLTASPEHVFSREEILRTVFTEGESPGSVDTYVYYLRRKSTPELIETVRGRGYRAGAFG
ncbi:response regulator transcription factor [Brachybacterium huguangmaarense]|uniref:Response regulator transcription factor n=1 Tax=Brachybacterium huguangmaarense TaxID=1652028 RepID=A0ABY6FZU6_9MICO|nr:response regulator transcription factor [Brachybacterium huguangmaarense]UYG16239.1 response regulator transcription factor [Brachybacterium huguangmaarense]